MLWELRVGGLGMGRGGGGVGGLRGRGKRAGGWRQ